ncbi:hypothetical protein AAVH_20211, partial [Aphelenchoides avenae]
MEPSERTFGPQKRLRLSQVPSSQRYSTRPPRLAVLWFNARSVRRCAVFEQGSVDLRACVRLDKRCDAASDGNDDARIRIVLEQ